MRGLGIGALQPYDDGDLQVHVADCGDHPGGHHVATHDASEDVDEDALDVGIAGDDAERLLHGFLRGRAPDIKEVRRIAAIRLDDVHRAHRQPRTVDHAADGAVQLDVVEVRFRRLDFQRILLVLVPQFQRGLVAEERVVVKAHLRVERDHPPVARENEGVDFHQRAILGDKGVVE